MFTVSNKTAWFFLFAFMIPSLMLPSAASAYERERIISYDSHIRVAADSSLTVTETIEVYAAGYQIQRGIFRDFPTHYSDDMGKSYQVGFRLLGVKRDGQPEPHHLQYYSHGVRIYCGDADVYLSEGTYTYEITYQTDRQLLFNDDKDELYWNVTGNYWDFSIEQASATVVLPQAIDRDQWQLAAFTGYYGSEEGDVRAFVNESGMARFVCERELNPTEGLTIVAVFPKGIVREPTAAEYAAWWRRDHRTMITAGLAALAVFVYFMLAWVSAGVDPRPGPIYPRGAPPDELSPAACRYLLHLGVDNKTMVAAILSLGSKGYLKVSQTGPGDYTITRLGKPENAPEMSGDESAAYGALFSSGHEVVIDQDNRTTLVSCSESIAKVLGLQFRRRAFFLNRSLSVFGGLISAAGVIYTGTTVVTIERVEQALLTAGLAVLLIAINVVFYSLLPRYTLSGRRLRDHIEGFRMALRGVSTNEMDLSSEEDLERFKSYLPYAVALNADSDWSKRMDEIFVTREGHYYRPYWYDSYYAHDRSYSSICNNLSDSFTSSITSASTPPSSSSSGGGGFSGGGGGGGGGGGW